MEAGAVHERCGKNFLTVTPGVRFADGDAGDQKRVTTPAKAKDLGSGYIVVGRPITQAEVLMGTATAGIAHAAIAAHLLGLPMGYVRSVSYTHLRAMIAPLR